MIIIWLCAAIGLVMAMFWLLMLWALTMEYLKQRRSNKEHEKWLKAHPQFLEYRARQAVKKQEIKRIRLHPYARIRSRKQIRKRQKQTLVGLGKSILGPIESSVVCPTGWPYSQLAGAYNSSISGEVKSWGQARSLHRRGWGRSASDRNK